MPSLEITMGVAGTGGELQRLLERYGTAGRLAGAKRLYQEAERMMAESKTVVPVDTGNLRDTGHVAPLDLSGEAAEVVLGYGGPAAPYAVYVHENLAALHNPGQFAKFLEVPVLQGVQGLEGRLSDAIRREMEDAAR